MVRFSRTRRLVGAILFAIGLGALVMAGVRTYERHLRLAPSGGTAGGAAMAIDLCQRSTPPDVAAACIAEQARIDRAAQGVMVKWGALGLACLLSGVTLRRRRQAPRRAESDEAR